MLMYPRRTVGYDEFKYLVGTSQFVVMISYDLHTHTTYSDGQNWEEMAETAETVGLDGIGFTDHCPIGEDPFGRRDAFDFEETYADRRAEFDSCRHEYAVEILDGVEMNYDPRREARIRTFLEEANFAYTIGSVHYAGPYHVADPDSQLRTASDAELREVIDVYVDWQIQLIESELFDIIGHVDVVQRSEMLRGAMKADDYRWIAEALADSKTIPEINAGRLDRGYGTIHPHPEYLDIFFEEDIGFAIGTDAHAPDQLERRVELLCEHLDEEKVQIVQPSEIIA